MSEPADNGLSCDRAFDLLVELACDELTPELAAAVRKHADGCGRCGPELASLTRVMSVAEELPLAEPSKAVEERILRAAREALAARAGGTEAREPVRKVSEYRGWFARLSEWALSPQVAMASVLLLMVGIGLYALPIGRDHESVAFEVTPEEREPAPAPAASAVAAPVEEPADALEAASDRAKKEQPSKTMRETSKDEARRALGQGEGSPAPAKSRAPAGGSKSSNSLDDLGGLSEAKGASGGAFRDQKQQPATAPGSMGMEKASPKKADAPSSAPFAPAPPAAQAPAPTKPIAPTSKAAKPEAEVQEYQQISKAPSEAREEQKSAAGNQNALNDGIAAARRGAYAQAVSLLSPLVNQGPESVRANARLWLARSLRGQGKCAEALRYYGPVVQQANVAAEVLSEAADCYERTGENALAGKLRSRLNAQESRE